MLCVDPNAPSRPATRRGPTCAAHRIFPSRDFLDQAGLSAAFRAHAMPLQVMRMVVRAGSRPWRAACMISTQATSPILPFGWNLPNWLLRREGLTRIAGGSFTFRAGGWHKIFVYPHRRSARHPEAMAPRAEAFTVIAADEACHSPMRKAADIPVTTLRYGQRLWPLPSTTITRMRISRLKFTARAGRFTLVPLPDYEGKRPRPSCGWSAGQRRATSLYLPQSAFEDEMRARSADLYGPLRLISQRTI